MLNDYTRMYKYIQIEEVIIPVVKGLGEQLGGEKWVPIPRLAKDQNITMFFQQVQESAVWDKEEFETYFDAHYEHFEYDQEGDGKVRIVSPMTLLIKQLERAKNTNEYSTVLLGSDKVSELSLQLLLQALGRLGDDIPEKEDISGTIDRAAAYKKMFTIIPPVLKEKELKDLSLPYLSGMLRAIYKCPEAIRGQGEHAKLVTRFLGDLSTQLCFF